MNVYWGTLAILLKANFQNSSSFRRNTGSVLTVVTRASENMCNCVSNCGYKHLSNTMLHYHCKPPALCLTPSLTLPSSITLSPSGCPCASAAIPPSFLSLPGALCFFASSLHHPASSLTPLFVSLSLLSSFNNPTSHSCTPHLRHATSP